MSNGEDLPGNSLIGQTGYLRRKSISDPRERSDYSHLASLVESGEPPDSSAGGKQPKFTCFSRDKNAYVIVKFTSANDSAVSTRWSDILISEYYAAKVLLEHGFAAAESELVHLGSRTFLESVRFDRVGAQGRSSMLSLQCIDAEFVGSGTHWIEAMDVLLQKNLVNPASTIDAFLYHEFGRYINNSDMHLGNLSLGVDGAVFRVLPIYDMCSIKVALRFEEYRRQVKNEHRI